jgi:protoporphyrinogen oxidase
MTDKAELTIIGGGITGLAAAYIAAKQGQKVRVLEAGEEFGGLLRTFEVGGSRLEFFYHHFFTHDAEIHWLVKELGIEEKLIYQKTRMGVYRDGKHYDFNSPADLLKFKPISWLGKLRFAFTSLYLGKFAEWESAENIPALEWFYKYAGKSATDSLWKPMLDIKFGSYASQVPLAWMIGRLRQRLNSRKNGDERLGYLKGGLDTLLQALLSKLKELGVELINKSPVIDLQIDENNQLKSISTGSSQYSSDKFLFTIPGTIMSKVLKSVPQLSEAVSRIKYFGAVCVVLEMKKPLSKTYWLNVADPGFDFGGVIEHTNFISSIEYGGKYIAYLSRYFDVEDPLFNSSNEAIKEKMIPQLNRLYPEFNSTDIEKAHVFKTSTAATVCDLDFSKKVLNCKTEVEGMYIANMMHIYPDERSVNNSIRVASHACMEMGLTKINVPKGLSLSGKIGFNL